MKNLLIIILSVFYLSVHAQDLPSESSPGFAFPIGSTFTIELIPVDSVNFNYSVIEFELFQKTIDIMYNDSLFVNKGKENTITFYFSYGTYGETKEEQEKNMKVILLFKNYTSFKLQYSSDILRKEDGDFEPTSNVGSYPGVKTMEMWPYMIYSIGLREFKKDDEIEMGIVED